MEKILDRAEQLEKEYQWLKAVESYDLGMNLLPKDDFSRMGQTSERLSYALYRVAMQAESLNEFRERIREAIANYEKTKEFYEKSGDAEEKGRTLRCQAMLAFLKYWLAAEASEKKKLLNECWKLTKGALEAFESARAHSDYGKTFNQLSISSVFEFTFESDFQARARLMKETVECGEKAVKFLSTSDDMSELARARAKTVVCLGLYGYYCQNEPERNQSYQKGIEYWQKAKELSEEIATLESLCPVFGGQPFFGLEGLRSGSLQLQKRIRIC